MSKPKFNFGDHIYWASFETEEKTVPCPDCAGKRYNTIILDGETFTIDCSGCEKGYWGSVGYRTTWERKPEVRDGLISGVEQDSQDSKVFEYRVRETSFSSYIVTEDRAFATKEEALTASIELAAVQAAEDLKKVTQKTKPDKSWAWHVRYYQKQIKDAQETIDRATLQLDAARKYAKEPK